TGGSFVPPVQAVSTSAPDGYTLLLYSPVMQIAKRLQPSLPFDPVAEFIPVAKVYEGSGGLLSLWAGAVFVELCFEIALTAPLGSGIQHLLAQEGAGAFIKYEAWYKRQGAWAADGRQVEQFWTSASLGLPAHQRGGAAKVDGKCSLAQSFSRCNEY
ncbi:MAG: hypothetical protein EBV44_10670, partial [Synechococcaceae bacterium WB7_1B_046]|nr:hypothetical protein [Synechococcaceae bacterium WB7_1B_046]